MANGGQLSVNGILSRAWGLFRADWADYLQVGAVVWVAVLLGAALGQLHDSFALLGGILIVGPVGVGAVSALLTHKRTGRLDHDRVFDGFRMYPQAVVASVLAAAVHLLGLLACGVGIVPAHGLLLVFFPILCDQKDPARALRGSWNFFLRDPWALVVLALVLMVLHVVGALVFTVGLVATMPFAYLVSILLYEEALRSEPQPPAPMP
ncbi:hypothetical protein HS125_02135 [bacterium]|nr:hypothetical protein [bacterium]